MFSLHTSPHPAWLARNYLRFGGFSFQLLRSIFLENSADLSSFYFRARLFLWILIVFHIGQSSLRIVNLYPKLYTFCLNFFFFLNNRDLDPQLLNTDPIRIRIHNTDCNNQKNNRNILLRKIIEIFYETNVTFVVNSSIEPSEITVQYTGSSQQCRQGISMEVWYIATGT